MDKTDLHVRLKKLHKNYEDIRQAMLGTDWETKLELKNLSEKVAEEIRNTIDALQDSSVNV